MQATIVPKEVLERLRERRRARERRGPDDNPPQTRCMIWNLLEGSDNKEQGNRE